MAVLRCITAVAQYGSTCAAACRQLSVPPTAAAAARHVRIALRVRPELRPEPGPASAAELQLLLPPPATAQLRPTASAGPRRSPAIRPTATANTLPSAPTGAVMNAWPWL